ncbi:MAG: hypothetical protein M0C28_28920 [Candidatus Moduliflexus flocculans]|nr:hypothetical protein [Candidatus Moduliflexus flocculans]
MLCLAAILDTDRIEFIDFPENLFTNTRVQDPVLGNTSIMAADFEILKTYVKKFESGTWTEGKEAVGE